MSMLPDAKVLDEPTELLAFTRSSRAADVAAHAMAMTQTRRETRGTKTRSNASRETPPTSEVLVCHSALHTRQSPLISGNERRRERHGSFEGSFEGTVPSYLL
jgi:hypothetical protein